VKPPVALNILLFAGLLVSGGLNWVARRDPTRPNLDFFPDMARSVRYNAFSPNPNFADGKTLQRPVPGTIARGFLPLHYEGTPADAARAGEELHNPFSSADPRAVERGAAIFANFCLPCHGAAGKGDGPVVFRGYPAPPPLASEHALQLKDGQMFHILTYGQRNMPPYAAQISRDDRWKVILYVRSLQKQATLRTMPEAKAASAAGAAPPGGRP
jgi:mono/diheme cytochrome c family protein